MAQRAREDLAQDGRFRHGLIDVDVYFGVFAPNQGDLDDTAATTVRI